MSTRKSTPRGIYKRGSRYLVRIRCLHGSVSKTFSALDTAKRWQRQTLVGLEDGNLKLVDNDLLTAEQAAHREKVTDGRTVADLIKRFRESGECKVSGHILDHFGKRLGRLPVDELDAPTIADALDSVAWAAPATWNRYRAGIHRLLNFAVRRLFWLPGNPATPISLKREDNRRDRVITPDEERRLLAACDAQDGRGRLATAFALAMATGARVGELEGLTWADVDLTRGTLRLGRTKNGNPRTLVVRGHALERLKEYAKVRPLNDAELLLRNDTGTAPFQTSKNFRAAADSIGLTDVSMHCARHTFATRFARVAGVTLVQLRDALGHKSLAMVQRYSHEMVDDLAAKLEMMHGGAA